MKADVKKTPLGIQKEEEWLNEQGQNGQVLTGYHGDEYILEDISPLKYQYKVDLPSYIGSEKKEYLDFLEQTGITVVAEYGGRVYLRKNTADGLLDVYNEKKEIEKQMNKRYFHFFGIAISQSTLGIFMLVRTLCYMKPKGAPSWIAVVIDAGLVISGTIFLIIGIQKHRKYTMLGEERGIWE